MVQAVQRNLIMGPQSECKARKSPLQVEGPEAKSIVDTMTGDPIKMLYIRKRQYS